MLQMEIDSKRAEIKTDAYPMSIGELINLYENGEIEIHPDFQRYFRWSDHQKSRLVESILLGIPIPPIFVAQQPSGVWDVVDGLQRLSTIFQLVGILRDDKGKQVEPLILKATKYLPSMEGMRWEGGITEEENQVLTSAQKLMIKRAKLGISIILYDSDPRSKFELFERLNASGSPLTDQELRNSMLNAINPEFYEWMRNLSNDPNFKDCVTITPEKIDEQYDMELVLRFLVFRSIDSSYLTTSHIGDLSEFLTREMERLALNDGFDYYKEEQAFRRTFELLALSVSDNAFRKYDDVRDRFVGSFLVTPFEVIAFGLGFNYELWTQDDLSKILPRIKSIWSRKDIMNNSGSGIRANTRIPRVVPVGRQLFVP